MSLLRLWLRSLLPGFLLPWLLEGAALRIACIGDSITAGAGLSNPATESYPARLQRLLGTDYIVRNYGVSGRTLLKRGDYSWWKESYFKQSHDWLPDIVIIQLGTNDSKPYNWRYGTNFVADYEEFVAGYRNLSSAPQVIVCTPCPVYGTGAFDIKPGTVATNIAPAVRDLAARLGLNCIDLHARLASHQEWFPDTVHPNSKGMAVMTAIIYEALAGGPPAQPPPALELARLASNRMALQWPGPWAGAVIQSATSPTPGAAWTVVETLPASDGVVVRQTNTISGLARFYRLWLP